MDNLNISEFFTTKAQAADFSERLYRLSEMVYTTGFHLESMLMQLFGIEKKDKFLTLLRDSNVTPDSPSALKDFIIKVQTQIQSLPVASLCLAFEPTEQTLKTISDWFGMNTKTQVLFDFVINPQIIAGTTISYNGKFKDYSFQIPVKEALIRCINPTKIAPQHPSEAPPQQMLPNKPDHMSQTVNQSAS